MYSVDFPGSNKKFGPPENMTDEECLTINAQIGIDDQRFPYVMTAWQPNADDVKAINEGRPIYLKILGGGMPPVFLFTTDANGVGNWD